MHSFLAFLITVSAVMALPTQSSVGDALAEPTIEHALVSLINDVEVSAKEAGVLIAMDVTEGDVVKTGQLVAQVDDVDAHMGKLAAQIRLQAAQTQASDDTPIKYAESGREVAKSKLTASRSSNRRSPGSVPKVDIRTLELEVERFRLSILKSKLELRVAQMDAEVHMADVRVADEKIRRRRIESPLDGIVVGTFRQKGEWVNPGDPVLRVIRIDRLRVEGRLSALEYDRHEINQRPVTVEIRLARGRTMKFPGKVVNVSPLTPNNRYLVRAEVENKMERGHWMMNPGMQAIITVRTD